MFQVGCNIAQKYTKTYLSHENLLMMLKLTYNMEKVKSYPNTQLAEFTPYFEQIPWVNAPAIDYNKLKNKP